jgi:hypothetical protein
MASPVNSNHFPASLDNNLFFGASEVLMSDRQVYHYGTDRLSHLDSVLKEMRSALVVNSIAGNARQILGDHVRKVSPKMAALLRKQLSVNAINNKHEQLLRHKVQGIALASKFLDLLEDSIDFPPQESSKHPYPRWKKLSQIATSPEVGTGVLKSCFSSALTSEIQDADARDDAIRKFDTWLTWKSSQKPDNVEKSLIPIFTRVLFPATLDDIQTEEKIKEYNFLPYPPVAANLNEIVHREIFLANDRETGVTIATEIRLSEILKLPNPKVLLTHLIRGELRSTSFTIDFREANSSQVTLPSKLTVKHLKVAGGDMHEKLSEAEELTIEGMTLSTAQQAAITNNKNLKRLNLIELNTNGVDFNFLRNESVEYIKIVGIDIDFDQIKQICDVQLENKNKKELVIDLSETETSRAKLKKLKNLIDKISKQGKKLSLIIIE